MTNDDQSSRESESDVVVPVIREEVHTDAVAVESGGIRVTKRVEGYDEIVEQELSKGRVEVKRVKTHRVVDGPQAAQKNGKTLIIPVVSEMVRTLKEWVVTEEIHVTQIDEREVVQTRVRVNHEVAEIQRLDSEGRISPELVEPVGESAAATASVEAPSRRILSERDSMLRNRTDR